MTEATPGKGHTNIIGLLTLLVITFVAGFIVGRSIPREPVTVDPWVTDQVVHSHMTRLAKDTQALINATRTGRGFEAIGGKDFVYADMDGSLYYRYDSPEIDKIPPERLIWFSTPKEAEFHGYKPY
ncbi:MAG: hypothetical protein ACOYU7_01600 [Bacillota bacterium]